MPSRTTLSDNKSSSPLKRMPCTPEVARPIGRNASSVALNRMDCPWAETSSRSSSAEHSTAPTNSSPSRRLTATRPPLRLESNSVSLDFLTKPFLVASTRYGASS
ncbi:Uncharacterised protein [Mycobacteroides abscessus subsp. abscessus]|nr:Uncharacterised protein [Mycobacteroides abscessus subsp. abscessus]